jgi:hypothetical protein
MIARLALVFGLAACLGSVAPRAADEGLLIPKGAKVFIAPMEGFETYLSAALMKKEVPLSIVASKDAADFEITGNSETQKAGWAKTIMTGNGRADERGSITVTNLKSGVIVYAYAADKGSAFRGKQSVAESCAKHLKERIEKGK